MARDKIHYAVCRALVKAGWIILSDPYAMRIDNVNVEVDLELEKSIEFQKDNRRILVEIKSFINLDILSDFYKSNGQYDFYRDTVEELELEHDLYLAISTVTYLRLSRKPLFLKRLDKHDVKLIIIDLNTETVEQWIE